MRKRQTFILTVLTSGPEENPGEGLPAGLEGPSFCGQLKVISTGKTSTFTSLEELAELVSFEMAVPPKQDSHSPEVRSGPLTPPVASTTTA